MSTAEDMLKRLMVLPAPERTRVALALLKSVESFDPHAHLSDEELREELHARADADDEDESLGDALNDIRTKP